MWIPCSDAQKYGIDSLDAAEQEASTGGFGSFLSRSLPGLILAPGPSCPAPFRLLKQKLEGKRGLGGVEPPRCPLSILGRVVAGGSHTTSPPQRCSRLVDVGFPFPSLCFFCLCLEQYVVRVQRGGQGVKASVGRAQSVGVRCLEFSGSVPGYTVALESTFCS